MDDNRIKNANRLARCRGVKYTRYTQRGQEEGAINVTQFIEKIQNANISPKHLRELGLPSDWQKKVSPQFIERVARTANRYKRDLKELSKR